MKKSKIIVPALGILVLSTAASITGTVAWFSANANVRVDGMAVTTKVDSNLLISATNDDDEGYGAALTQGRVGKLRPASSINGVGYFYSPTDDIAASGATNHKRYIAYSESTAISHAGAGKTAYDAGFNTNYGVSTPDASTVVYGYIDYSFYLKGTNSEGEAAQIRMTKCNLLYNGVALNDTDHSDAGLAWRVAVFAKDSAYDTETTDEVASGDNQKTILSLSGATYYENGKAAATAYTPAVIGSGTAENPQTPEAPGTTAAVSKLNTAAVIKALANGATTYQKVTVRLWLEGEDTSCTNDTYAALTASYTLDLGFGLVKTSDTTTAGKQAVTAIGSEA